MNRSVTALVKRILLRANNHSWTLQGFGMLRLHLEDDVRLHVWSPDHATEQVSTIHDHPWDFTSHVLAGRVVNLRYRQEPGSTHSRYRILCGEGGGIKDGPLPVRLDMVDSQVIAPGQSYSQRAYELHESIPSAGTVTVIERDPLDDPDHASVFCEIGTPWVSAEPRPATSREVEEIVGKVRWP